LITDKEFKKLLKDDFTPQLKHQWVFDLFKWNCVDAEEYELKGHPALRPIFKELQDEAENCDNYPSWLNKIRWDKNMALSISDDLYVCITGTHDYSKDGDTWYKLVVFGKLGPGFTITDIDCEDSLCD
jgi:hypothetical protein